MKTLRLTLIAFILFFLIGNVKAQRHECFEAKKVAYLTQEINLSIEEAQMFWPIYNELNNKLEELQSEKRRIFRELKNNNSNYLEDELVKLSDDLIQLDVDEAQLKKDYHVKFKAVLPATKLLAYYHAERKFKKHVLREIQQRKQHRKRGGNK